MRYDFRGLVYFTLAWFFSAVIWMSFFGCSASYHLNKFQSKGGVCGQVDTLKVVDSIPYLVNDTIIWRYYYKDSLIINNDRVIPKTRYELRTEYKIHRDTLRLKETIIKQEAKTERANDRKMWIWVIMGAMLLVAIYMIKKY